MTTDERIDRLITVAEAHQAHIDAHDAQIEALIALAEAQARRNEEIERQFEALRASTANLEKQWQAYLRSLPSQ